MADTFLRLVNRGAKYNRTAYASEIALFEKKSSSLDETPTSNASADFFHNTQHTQQQQQPHEKNKEQQEPDHSDSDSEEEEDDNQQDGAEHSQQQDHIKQLKSLRRSHGIHVTGSDVPHPVTTFQQMKEMYHIPDYIITNLQTPTPNGCGYTSPTPIQMQSIPILCSSRELLACAPTGSGKTVAYIVPILTTLQKPGKHGLRAVILAPTKELAEQIHRQFTIVSHGLSWRIFTLSKSNAHAWGAGSSGRKDVLITTPMRLVHMVQQQSIDLSKVEYLILDESDRLFDMGFMEQIDEVMAACTYPQLKRALFSATMMQGVESLARTVLHDPIRVTIGARNAASSNVRQELVFVGTEDGKLLALRQRIIRGLKLPVLIFVQSKERAQQLFHALVYDNINVDMIHAERTQAQRSLIISKFRSGSIWVLICTDLMARGIDFKGVNCVINYDFPQDTVSYIHRIGRTGRAGRDGHAITFFTEQDAPLLRNIAKVMKLSGCDVPDWMLELNRAGRSRLEKLKAEAPARAAIGINPIRVNRARIAAEKRAKLKRKQDADTQEQEQEQPPPQQQPQPQPQAQPQHTNHIRHTNRDHIKAKQARSSGSGSGSGSARAHKKPKTSHSHSHSHSNQQSAG